MELVDSAESDRWTVMRSAGSEFSLCGHVHQSLDGARACARAWQAHSPRSFRFQIPGVEFVGPDASELAASFHSANVDCGCPTCSRPAPSLRLVVAEDRESEAKMLVLKSDVAQALADVLEWCAVLAEAVGSCDALLAQGARGPYRVYLCDGVGRILGTAPTGNPKLYEYEPGRQDLEDGVFTGQVAWRAFGTTVQGWVAENRSLGELTLR